MKRLLWYSCRSIAAITRQSRRRYASELCHDRHQIASSFELAHHLRVHLWIHSAFDEVEQRIPLTVLGIFEVRHRADGFAGRGERDFDGVVESASGEPFEACAVRTYAPDARAEPFVVASVFGVDVEAVAAIGEIEPAVRTEDRAMQARGIGGHLPSGDDDFSSHRRRHRRWCPRSEANPAAMRRRGCLDTRRRRQAVSASRRRLCPVRTLHPRSDLRAAGFVIRIGCHLVVVQSVSGRFADEETAAIIEGPHHGIGDEVRARCAFDFEAGGNAKRGESGRRRADRGAGRTISPRSQPPAAAATKRTVRFCMGALETITFDGLEFNATDPSSAPLDCIWFYRRCAMNWSA